MEEPRIELCNLFADLYRTYLDHAAPNVLHNNEEAESLMIRPEYRHLEGELKAVLEGHVERLFKPEIAPKLRKWAEKKLAESAGFSKSQMAVVLLKQFDSIGDVPYDSLWSSRMDWGEFTCLNHNAKETGLWVIPRLKSYLQRKESLNFQKPCFVHFSIIEADKLKVTGIPLTIRNCMDVRTALSETRPLRIGLCPLTSNEMLVTEETTLTDRRPGFAVTGLRDEPYVGRLINAALEASAEVNADVLIFPEMLGSEAFRKLPVFNRDYPMALPGIICMPTIWKNYKNTAEFLDLDGDTVLRQEKQFPFYWHDKDDKGKTKPAGKMEDLRNPDRTVCVFHRKYLGRVVVCICRDFLIPEYRNLLIQQLEPNLLLVPSYSAGTTPFINDVSTSADCGGITVWIDTCSAIKAKKGQAEVGCIYLPPTSGSSDQPDKYGFKKCEEERCGGCVQFADIMVPGSEETDWTLKPGFRAEPVWLKVFRDEVLEEDKV